MKTNMINDASSMNSKNCALITGASCGIGLELAKQHARQGGDLILVARSQGKLEALKHELETKHSISVAVIVEDLSHIGAANRVFAQTQSMGLVVDILINNAGFGGYGLFHTRDLHVEESMMQVNMAALTSLTHLCLQGMVERKYGRILNVSSTASFVPGPLLAIYCATKAYVTSFSQAIAEEVAAHNITVTALCPGPVKTGFQAAANLEGVAVFDQSKSAQSVAECGYKAMMRGELVVFNETKLKLLLNWVVPLLPRRLVLKASRKTMEKS